MATSEVKRIIEPVKPAFSRGDIVQHSEYGPVLVSDHPNQSSALFQGVVLAGADIGWHFQSFSKDKCKPFKGSVTLTEG